MMNTATSSMMTETMKSIIMKTMFTIMTTKKMAALGSIPMKTMTMGITSMFTYRFTTRKTILTDHISMQITILMGIQRETMTMMKTITRITTMNIMKTTTRIKTMNMIKTMTTTMTTITAMAMTMTMIMNYTMMMIMKKATIIIMVS